MRTSVASTLTSGWLEPSSFIAAQEEEKLWSWVFAEIQAVSQRFCHVVSSCSQRAFLFFLQCVERSKFLYENLVYEEKSFPLVCLALSTKQQLDKRKVFFF